MGLQGEGVGRTDETNRLSGPTLRLMVNLFVEWLPVRVNPAVDTGCTASNNDPINNLQASAGRV
jgi:hypothetical protein